MRFARTALVLPPTGRYCREDRCQSYFAFDLLPSMRAPLEETEAAAGIRAAGGTPWLLDAPAMGLDETEALSRIARWQPDVVVLTATFGSLPDDLLFAARLRECLNNDQQHDVKIGLRGAPVYAWGTELLEKHATLDFLIRGEPELSFAQLCREGLDGAGVLVRGRAPLPPPSATDLNALPWADRAVLDQSLYRVRGSRRPQATIHVQRGCPFPCSYCLVSLVSGKKARHRAPEDVAKEMASLVREGITSFYLRADTLTLDKHWARALGDSIASLAPQARWVSTTRVELADEETLRHLAKGGCYGLSFGVETGSVLIGEKVNKPPNLEAASAAFRGCDSAGIASLMYVMVGFYWESRETLAETAQFIARARPDLLTTYWAHPYPGTAYFEQMKAAQVPMSAAKAQARQALEPPAISTRAIRRWSVATTLRHYARFAVAKSLFRKLKPVFGVSLSV